MLVVTGLGTMSGCSHNQEALTWAEVISDIRDKYPDVNQLRTDELYSWLTDSRSEPIILIDARGMEEFRVSHITGAMNIPYDKDPLKHLTDIKPDSPIVVYCSVGYRSSILAIKLNLGRPPAVGQRQSRKGLVPLGRSLPRPRAVGTRHRRLREIAEL